MSNPSTLDLDAIAARAAAIAAQTHDEMKREPSLTGEAALALVGTVPALVAEVRRLRAALQAVVDVENNDVAYYDGPSWCSSCVEKTEEARQALDPPPA